MIRKTLPMLLFALMLLPGCRSVYYDVMEQMGQQKRHILRARVEDAREEQQEAQKQFESAYEAFASATRYQGGDLEAVYETLDGEYQESEEKAQELRDRIASIETVAQDLFAEWQEEIGLISSAELRRSSEQSLRDTQRRYDKLMVAMRRTESKMDPVLTAFRDQVLYLKHNLNARAIASLESNKLEIQRDVDALIADMKQSIQEADTFLATLD